MKKIESGVMAARGLGVLEVGRTINCGPWDGMET